MANLIHLLQATPYDFATVVPFNAATDKLLALDFTAHNDELNTTILDDTELFSNYVAGKLAAAGAVYGIGGYAEHRTIYSRSDLFDGDADEPRRLHLGTDIWGLAGTPILAPMNGTVHSFAFNEQKGDYGATILLQHELDGTNFYTLYGHLSLASIQRINVGDSIGRGEIVAWFGLPEENGHWPPHLHFQVIIDVGDHRGDYPGVCKYSEKEQWLSNSPDPDMILHLNRYLDTGMSLSS